MTRLNRLLAGLCLLILLLAGVSWGQSRAGGGGGGGPSSLYNPQTVITVSGIVVSLTPPPAKEALPHLVYLTLQAKEDKITVFLGPNLYVDKLPVRIKVLDRIEVTGSRVTWEGKTVLLAGEVKKGDDILKLRDPQGVPVWSGQRGR